jgi:hypothetical protein
MTTPIEWERDLAEAKGRSLRERKPILIEVIKDPCRGCRKLEAATFSDDRVAQAIAGRFVPLRIDLFRDPRDIVRPLDVIWTPTVLFADRRGDVHYRSVNFLPPDLFLTMLDIGEAQVDMYWSRTDHAIELLRGAYERDPEGLLAPEVLYWWGTAIYLKTHSDPETYEVWDFLRSQFPDSLWAVRVP